MRNIIIIVIIAIIAAVIFLRINKKSVYSTNIIKDTNTIIRYEKLVSHDTVIKPYEKIIYRQAKPQVIYFTKTDTILAEKIRKYEIPVRIEKESDMLKIHSYNPLDSLFREYEYKNISDDFTINTGSNKVIVKTKNIIFTKPVLGIDYMYSFSDKNSFLRLSLESGISVLNKLDINAKGEYNLNSNKFNTGINLKLKIF